MAMLKNLSAMKFLLFAMLLIFGSSRNFVRAADEASTDSKPDEVINDDATVDEEKSAQTPDADTKGSSDDASQSKSTTPSSTDVLGETSKEDEAKKTGILDGFTAPSEHVETMMAFENPAIGIANAEQPSRAVGQPSVEIPANKPVTVLIGFTNKDPRKPDDNDVIANQPRRFTLDYVTGAFRYPQDYSYYVQNFTIKALAESVDATIEKTVSYTFVPALNLANRPFGLAIRVGYHDQENKQYTSHVFNQTISIVEVDEGFDTESFFLYIMIVAAIVLAAFGLYHVFLQYGSRKLKKVIRGGGSGDGFGSTSNTSGGSSSNADLHHEMGTGSGISKDVNLEWVPSSHLKLLKQGNASATGDMSPRKRKTVRTPSQKSVE